MVLREKVRQLLESAGERQLLFEHEAKGLLRELGIGVPRGFFVPAGHVVPPVIAEIPYPLVAKVVSSRIGSKSDIGGVRLGIKDGEELQRNVAELSLLEQAEGVLIEEMIAPGFEVIVGGTTDVEFGPIVMFGLGGLFVELFRDISFALAPVTEAQALWLVNETKGEIILKGFRGKPPLDTTALVKIIVLVSELIATGLLQEIDLNPVALYPSGAVVLDAKMKRKSSSASLDTLCHPI